MPWTTKILVLANRTVESKQLREVILARAAGGPVALTLVAPADHDKREVVAERLERTVRGLRDAGIATEGTIGDSDPMAAIADVWDPRKFDEVIVSTLPGGESRWLTIDLPHRVERLTGARVTHVVSPVSELVV